MLALGVIGATLLLGLPPAYAAPPIAQDDELTVVEDTAHSIFVLFNDSDADFDPLTVTGNTDPAHGTATCDEFGDCTYTPDTGYLGPDSFDYTVSDGTETDIGTVAVTVVANSPPVAVDDELTVVEERNGAVFVLSNDDDPDLSLGDELSVTANTDPAHGTATCDEFGDCTYTPDTGYLGPDSFDYTVSDGTETDTGTVAVTVVANSPPVAVDDELTVAEDTFGVVFVLDNDSDPNFDPLTVTGNTDPAHGTVTCEEFGDCTYTPDTGYVGPDSFDYTVSDGTETDTGTVAVTVLVNLPETVTNDDAGAAAIAAAITTDPSTITGAGFDAVPTSGTPNAVVPGVLGGFPTDGSSFGLLTSGDANLADDPNDSGSSGQDIGGASVRGNTDFDVTILAIDLNVPSTANCLTIDFQFLSEEYPEFVGTSVQRRLHR